MVSFDTRPFPGSETDLLLAQVLWLSSGTLALHRISREHGIEQIWTEPILYSGGCAFEDERDLLYRVEYSSVWVHDVSDPYQPLRIHKHLFFEEVYQPNGRSLFHLLCEGEILHVSARNHRPGYNYRREQIPVWFDGARFVPAGKSLHAPIELWRQYGYSGYLWFRGGHSSAILTFAPPPRARREECCWDGPPPFER